MEKIIAALEWHRELSLVPLIAGMMLPGIYYQILIRSGVKPLALLAGIFLAGVSLLVGWTALLDSVEAGSFSADGSFIVFLGALGLMLAGIVIDHFLASGAWQVIAAHPTEENE